MKKAILTFWLILASVCLASANQGGKVHLVEKGDSIYKIAIHIFHIPWGDVKPEARKRNIISPGQKIALEELLDLTTIRVWREFNSNPFKKYIPDSQKQLGRDIKGLQILGLTGKQAREVIRKHWAAISGKESDFKWDRIEKGDRFDKVLFGKFYIWRNALVDWGNIAQAARIYEVDGIRVWYPVFCGNWSLKAMNPPPKPSLPPPPPPTVRGEIAIAQYKAAKEKYQLDWDSSWGGFRERFTDGNRVHGFWQSSTIYPFVSKDSKGNEWSLGANYTTRNWWGKTGGERFSYRGDVDIGSLAGRFRDKDYDWEIISRFGGGRRKDEGFLVNQWGRYNMSQSTDILNFYSSAEYNGRSERKWFSKLRASMELEFGFGEEKKDFWTDKNGRKPLFGSPEQKDAYNFALTGDIFNFDRQKTVQIWGEYRSTYYQEGYKWGNSFRGGLSFLDEGVKIGAGYNIWDKTHPDSYGLYAEANFYHIYMWLTGKLGNEIGRFKGIDQNEREAEILKLLKEQIKEQKEKTGRKGNESDEIDGTGRIDDSDDGGASRDRQTLRSGKSGNGTDRIGGIDRAVRRGARPQQEQTNDFGQRHRGKSRNNHLPAASDPARQY